MDELSIDCARRISAIAQQLMQVAQRLTGDAELSAAQPTPEMLQKEKEKRCLYCGKVVDTAAEQYRRGLCQADYQKVNAQIKQGHASEAEMIVKGWWLPAKKPGKQAEDRRLEEYIQAKTNAAKLNEAHTIVTDAGQATPPAKPQKPPPKNKPTTK
jgi:hypothetical protein